MDTIIDYIIKKSRISIIIIILITIPLGFFYSKQTFFNHLDIYFNENDPDLLFYKKFQKTYGNEELAVISFEADDIFTKSNIQLIHELTKKLKSLKGVQRVFSLTEYEEAIGANNTISFQKIIPERKLNNDEYKQTRKKALDDELLVNNLISKDGRVTAILIELDPFDDNNKKSELLLEIMTLSRKINNNRVNLRFSGVPYVEIEMNQLSRLDFLKFTPIVFVMIFFIILLLIRRLSLTFLCLLNLGFGLIWAIGFMIMCGETLNIVNTILGPVILAISIADSVHLLSHYRGEYSTNGFNHLDAVKEATKAVYLPCLLTSLTTGAGFFSFITSSIRPVKILGIFTSIGVMFAFILTVSFLPSIMNSFSKKFEKKEDFNDSTGNNLETGDKKSGIIDIILLKIGEVTTSNYRIISLLLLVILIAAVVGIFNIKFETNTINYLPDNSQIVNDANFIEKNLGGTIPFAIIVRANGEEYKFDKYENIKIIDETQNHILNNIKKYPVSFSIADYYKVMNQALNNGEKKYRIVPGTDEEVLEYYELGDIEVLDRIISPDKMETRISFQSKWTTNEDAKKTSVKLHSYLSQKFGKKFTYKITGMSMMYLQMEENLKESQMKSFSLAFGIIFIMMFFVCRNVKLTIISMVPNLFPIAVTLGVMGWYGIPLDISTIMIASVTIGIAVDDTIHFIVWYKRKKKNKGDVKDALLATYQAVGKPIVITSIVLFLGFFVLILGAIKPTQYFGVLVALSMLFALIGDLFFLPALLIIFNPKVES